MGKTVKITAVQMRAEIGDKNKNYDKITQLLKNSLATDIIVLPEVWNIGWDCSNFRGLSENINNSESIDFLKTIAKNKKSNIIGGSIITKTDDGKYYNTCVVINRSGEVITHYNKNHLYSYYGSTEGKEITRGSNAVMADIEGVKYGLTICYDIRFPEIYRAYRKSGADVLINCAAWANTKPIPWEMMTKSRAIENQTYMVAVNQFGDMGNNESNLGHTRIIDYNGNTLSEILEGEGIIHSEIKLNEMYEFRSKCTILKDIRDFYEVI